jgi:predicted transposase YdaD
LTTNNSEPHLYDEFIDENPVVLERVARGEARGKIEGLQEAILNLLQVRFSALAAASQAQQAITAAQDVDKLKQLQRDLLLAPDEHTACVVLGIPDQRDLL